MTFDVVTAPPAPAVEAAWREFLARADYACHYVTPALLAEPQFRHRRPFAVLIRERSSVVAVATGLVDGRTVQCGLQSRPQIAIDPSADQAAIGRTLAQALIQAHDDAAAVQIVSWSPLQALHGHEYREQVFTGERGIVVLDLERGVDALVRDFWKGRRTNIKKAIRVGVEVTGDPDDADLASYFAIYLEWCRTKQQPALSFEVFRESVQLRANRRLFLAKYNGVVIAGATIRFCPGGVMEYSANSSIKEHQHLRPNDILHLRIIEWGCAEGIKRYALGGAHLFLRQFGGTIVNTYQYRLDRTLGKRIEMRERLVAAARWSWKRLPDPIRTRIKQGADLGAASE
jgi:hypothetical protein